MESTLTPLPGCPKDGVHLKAPDGGVDDDGRGDVRGGHGGGVVVFNKTGEFIAEMSADEYGNGMVGAYNRKGNGRTLRLRAFLKRARRIM